jgi:hypothetical protein
MKQTFLRSAQNRRRDHPRIVRMDQQMSEIEIYEERLKEARAREAETFAVAVAALREAIRAKWQVLYE